MNGLRRNIGIRRTSAGALAAIGAAVLVAACGGSSSNRPGQSAAASLKRAAYVSTAAAGFKVAMTMRVAASTDSSAMQSFDMTMHGSVSPASHKGEMTMHMALPTSTATKSINVRVVLDGTTMYMKMPAALTGSLPNAKPWLSMNLREMGKVTGISGYGSLLNNSSNYTDPSQYLDFLRATADGTVKDLGQVTVNGVPTTHYQADVDLAKLPNAVPAADRQAVEQLMSALQNKGVNTQMPMDAWIDASHHLRRVHISYTMSVQSASVAMDITENISDYGPQPAPTVPSADQTTDLLSLIKSGG